MTTAATFQKPSDWRDWSIPQRKSAADPGGNRKGVRFEMSLPVRYRSPEATGWGLILNMSSSGALFTTQHRLPKDSEVELCVRWPVLLLDAAHLMLVAAGRIVREETGRAALRIQRYEFRTCSPTFFEGAPEHGGSYLSARGLQVQVADDAVQ
jgi:hypothetical protein